MPQLTICIKYMLHLVGVKALHFDALHQKGRNNTPFRDFLTTLPAKDRAKLLATIAKIEEHGLAEATRQQWVKHLEGAIWEIRSQFANNIQRACYFHAERMITTSSPTVSPRKPRKHHKAKSGSANFLQTLQTGRIEPCPSPASTTC